MSKQPEINIKNRNILFYSIFGIFAMLILLFSKSQYYFALSYIITGYFFLRLIFELGRSIPLKEITLFITSLQYLLSPTLDYEFLGRYTFLGMPVPAEMYFRYIIPAFLAFWAGFSIPVMKKRINEAQLVTAVKENASRNTKTGIALIVVGVFFTLAQSFITFPGLAFIITLLGMLKFVGMIYIWLSDYKYVKLLITGVLLMTAYEALTQAIFINLIFVGFLFFCFYSLFKRIHPVKSIVVALLAASFLFLLQSVKTDYRKNVWAGNSEKGNVSLLADLFSNRLTTLNEKQFMYSAAVVNARLNQGWVLGLIMRHIPVRQPFFEGEIIYDEVAGLILPRLLFSDKAVAQSSDKFYKFVGYRLRKYTIAVGIPGDGYGNFGVNGGIIFCFIVGLFFNLALSIFYRICRRKPPLLLWSILIFFYLMRAGDDTYIISNWILKSSLFVWIIYFINKKAFAAKFKLGNVVQPPPMQPQPQQLQ